MFSRLTVFFFICVLAIAASLPSDNRREKRDVLDSVKDTLNDAGKAVGEAGDAVVQGLKPTEKSTIDKIADEVKSVG